ncbi:MAG: cell wall-binding repeat-containing protein [Firmicutes bacterium]|nr:cell wall-binding repeat-containing protein [Alicyclobacillaceae bacterium]MCL6498148.1 cell wall-binding repeat-containing protein [Bacillota bacterium]
MLRKWGILVSAAALVLVTVAFAWPKTPERSVWMHPAALEGPWRPAAAGTPWQGTVYLTDPHLAALLAYATAVCTPGSPLYRHFLSPAELAARFGPAPAVVQSVRQELTQEGFRVEGATAAGFGLRVAATVGTVNRVWQAGLVLDAQGHWTETRPVVLRGPEAEAVGYISNLGTAPRAMAPLVKRFPTALRRPAQVALLAGNVTVSVEGPASVPTGQPIRVAVQATDPLSGLPLAGWQVTATPTGNTGNLSSYALSDLNGNLELDQSGRDVLVLVLNQSYTGPWQVEVTNGIVAYAATLPALTWSGPEVLDQPLTPNQVNGAYQAQNLVAAARAKGGMRIGIFASSAPTLSDLEAFENAYGLPASAVHIIPIDGGENQVVSGWHGELMLDMERAVSSAPGATLDLYTLPADSGSPLDVLAQAIQNDQDQVFSMSVVMPEDQLSAAEAAQWNALMAEAASEGMTLVAGSGDSGPYADPNTNQPVVNWPAASRWVTGVGGTELGLTPNLKIASQWAWGPDGLWQGQIDGSGGGYSSLEPAPAWQKPVLPPGELYRGVPDISFLATYPYYQVYDNGQWTSMGGTSAATPTFAGWVADMAVLSGRLGFLNPTLYQLYTAHPSLFDPVTEGGNAVYQAGPGWNPVTGLGSVWIDAFFAALAPAKLALTASATEAPVGEAITIQASLENPAGQPLTEAGATVKLLVSAPMPVVVNGAAATSATATTDSEGVAQFTLRATAPGTATVTAEATMGATTLTAGPLTVRWAASTLPVERLAGPTRTATAVAIAEADFPSGVPSHTAILASGQDANLVDALTAAPLAHLLNVPILLTDSPSAVGTTTAAALAKLGVTRVILVGADTHLADHLPAGVSVAALLGGATRYDTAAAVAQAVAALDPTGITTVFVASGEDGHLVDALTADPAAALLGAPILLVPQTGAVPSAEAPFLDAADTVYVVGAAAGYPLALPAGATRLSGDSRYATAAVIDRTFFPHPTALVVANGETTHLVDALTGGPLAAALKAPLVLTQGGLLPPATAQYLNAVNASALTDLIILGGPASIPSGTGSLVTAALAP